MSIIKNLSIRNKLIALMLLVLIPALVLGFTVVIIRDVIHLRDDMVNNTRLYAALLGEVSISPITFGASKKETGEILRLLGAIPNIENGFLYTENHELYVPYNRSDKKFEPPPGPFPNEVSHKFTGNYLHLSYPIIYKGRFIGTVYLRASKAPLQQSIRSRIVSLLLVMLGLIVLSYFLVLGLQGAISHPILKLARVTEKIPHHFDYSIRVHHDGRDEIGVLYQGFNNMLEQIQMEQKKRDEAEAEQQRLMIRLAEKNKELEQVVYVTSHDLRSPLVNIQGFSQELSFSLNELSSLLNRMEQIPPEAKDKIDPILHDDIQESLKYIEASTSKMDGLLSGLLKLSRVNRMATSFAPIDMNHLISDIIKASEFQLKEKGVNIRVEQLPLCFGNEMQVNQLFSNLLSNALKYLDQERPGEISISGKESTKDDYVVYCVEDNGIGIPEDHQKKIFEIFHRLNPDETPGEGLGLTIVNRIVSRHHGSVWVESQPGVGSKFFISLPSHERTAPVPDPDPAAAISLPLVGSGR